MDQNRERRNGYAVMPHSMHIDEESTAIDFVRELRLRQWARQNFVPPESRKASWHPVVLDEMRSRDQEIEAITLIEEVSDREQPARVPYSPLFFEASEQSSFV